MKGRITGLGEGAEGGGRCAPGATLRTQTSGWIVSSTCLFSLECALFWPLSPFSVRLAGGKKAARLFQKFVQQRK